MTDTATVTIYSAPWCAFCKTEKQYLEHLGVPFTEKDIEADRTALEEIMKKSGAQTVPITEIGDIIIRGFDRAKIDTTLKEKGLL